MRKLIVCLIVLVFAAVPASAMVLDGSFEGFVTAGSGWTAIATDGVTFGAWTAHMPEGRNAWLLDDGTTMPDGTTSLHVGDGYDIGAVSQLVSGFVIGQTYSVSLAGVEYGSSANHPGLTVKVTNLGTATDDLDTIFALGADWDNWLYSSASFVASATELELYLENPGSEDPILAATNIDDVSIVLVPEPATMCLLGLGGLLIRRKR